MRLEDSLEMKVNLLSPHRIPHLETLYIHYTFMYIHVHVTRYGRTLKIVIRGKHLPFIGALGTFTDLYVYS